MKPPPQSNLEHTAIPGEKPFHSYFIATSLSLSEAFPKAATYQDAGEVSRREGVGIAAPGWGEPGRTHGACKVAAPGNWAAQLPKED